MIGTFAAFVTYEIVFCLNDIEPRATVSWAIAFVIGMFRQHHLHRVLAFPATRVRYGVSLQREWLSSVLVLIFGLALNYFLTERVGLHHRYAWATCLISVAGLEYGLLKFFVFRRTRRQEGGP
ncbi:GtrA family protein [Seohaeicola saemankumensis]|nr:GtrA family protein [Seohaeicola saemankumensis]MCA0869974.1 GtrA family protein [Seohaeicola saemankumensis]